MLKTCVVTILFSIWFVVHAQNAIKCKTPDNKDGTCIPISTCQTIRQFLAATPMITAYQRTQLAQYQCNSNAGPKACCPNSAILIPSSEKAQSTSTKSLDVSNHVNFRLLPTDCGSSKNAYRIINGEVAGLFQFPWMALLSYTTQAGPQFKCGGSIINERHILTAAHCITPKLLGVRVGEHNISSTRDCEEDDDGVTTCAPPVQDVRVERTIVHPKYIHPVTGFDIALIRLDTPLKITENVRPICLPTTSEVANADLVGKKLTVTGFGTTENASSSNIMLLAKLLVASEDKCRSQYRKLKIQLDNTQICAGDSQGSDSCNGDSGGPLQGVNFIGNDKGVVRIYQYGVVSIGPRPCANIEYPGVYTKVGSYIKWILDNIKP